MKCSAIVQNITCRSFSTSCLVKIQILDVFDVTLASCFLNLALNFILQVNLNMERKMSPSKENLGQWNPVSLFDSSSLHCSTQKQEEELQTSLLCYCYCFLVEYLALAGLMNLLAQLVDKERNVLIPAFKNKTKNIAINHYYQPSTFFYSLEDFS